MTVLLIVEFEIPNAAHVLVPVLKNALNAYHMPTSTLKVALVNVHGHGVGLTVICGWVSVTKSVILAMVQLS